MYMFVFFCVFVREIKKLGNNVKMRINKLSRMYRDEMKKYEKTEIIEQIIQRNN